MHGLIVAAERTVRKWQLAANQQAPGIKFTAAGVRHIAAKIANGCI
jgi:hypothetical protein